MHETQITPDLVKQICQVLHLPEAFCQFLSSDRLVCIVNDDWIKSLHNGLLVSMSGVESLDTCQVERLLSRSCYQLPTPWMRISIKAISKSQELYEELPGQFLQKQWACGSLYEFMSHVSKENVNNLWLQAQSTLKGGSKQPLIKTECLSFSPLVRQVLIRLMPAVFIIHNADKCTSPSTSDPNQPMDLAMENGSIDSSSKFTIGSSRTGSFYTTSQTTACHGIVPVHAVIESEDCFIVIQPYVPYSLADAVSFSPSILESNHAKPLFIVYQLLHAMQALHSRGLRMGDVQLQDILMDKNMWLQVTNPRLSILKKCGLDSCNSKQESTSSNYLPATLPETSKLPPPLQDLSGFLTLQSSRSCVTKDKLLESACQFINANQYKHFEITKLDSVVDAWIHRRIPNFQYLMILNHLAGRRIGDPNNHPVMPWVLDFSSPDSGYRDLTKSKFRLNKGDGQLDFTYSGMNEMSDSNGHVPHHVSDILSDITYYVYKARRTPKSVLCAHVRSNWVPHEYPLSMQRLQDWTPDECIPEFFTDPTIFDSIHEDLPDLEIPPWCKNTLDFVMCHLAALESDQVSSNLHHWIDLTFGYKLSGVPAVKAKNVHLHLVDQHTDLTSHGAKQLFQQPHPSREGQNLGMASVLPNITRGLLNSQLLSYGFPETDGNFHNDDMSSDSSEPGQLSQAPIHLPKTYNPLLDLDQCESLQEFKAKALHVTGFQAPPAKVSPARYQEEGITEDMVTLLCLVCEIFLDSKLRMRDSRPPLWNRIKSIRRICSPEFTEIQRPLQNFVCLLFESLEMTPDKKFIFQAISSDGTPPATPGFLIQPYCDLIPFPAYFSELYACLTKLEEKAEEIQKLSWSCRPQVDKKNRMKQLEREKVPIVEAFLWRHQGYLGSEGMGLILPYIQDLLQNEFTTVQAAWSLFDVTTRELGPTESTNRFLTCLTALFSGELTTAKHIKLYHRSFLIQLIIRLGLKTFLVYFSTLLVEAVAGYKDFESSNRFYPQELLEEEEILNCSKPGKQEMDWSERKDLDFVDALVDEEETEDDNVSIDRDVDDPEDIIVDPISLDGGHVLLENEEIDLQCKESLRDFSERISLDSEGSDDRLEVRKKIVLFEDQEGEDGHYGSADQHSIHSISHFLPRTRGDSPNILEDLDPCCLYQESQTRCQQESRENMAENSWEKDLATNNPKMGSKDKGCQGAVVLQGNSGGINVCEKTEDFSLDSVESELASSQETVADSGVPSCTSFSLPNRAAFQADLGMDTGCIRPSEDTLPENLDKVDGSYQRSRSSSDMVRSETEDLMHHLSSDGSGSIINIRDIAADSVKWLCHKLGPVLATKYLSRNLVRMLALCYIGQEQVKFIEKCGENVIKTSRLVVGDQNGQKVLECIGFTVILYGEQVVLIQCLPNIMDMITMAQKRLSPRSEGGLIAAVVLLSFLIPYMSDSNLMNLLEDSIIYNCISPVITIITSSTTSFPGGALSRFVLCHKLIDLLYILGLRLGFEMTRKYLTSSMLRIFDTFSNVYGQSVSAPEGIAVESTNAGSYGSDDSFLNIKMDLLTQQYKIGSPVDLRTLKSPTRGTFSKMHSLSALGIIDDKDDFVDAKSPSTTAEKCTQELKCVFSPELAQACYIPLCRIFGSIHMEECLHNEDLIRQLCTQHDTEADLLPEQEDIQTSKLPEGTQSQQQSQTSSIHGKSSEDTSVCSGIGSNVAVVGNRIQLTNSPVSTPTQAEVGQFGRGYKHSGILSIHMEDLRSVEMEQNKSRHLKGNWLAYWERELGLHERDTMFNFMQIELQTYSGHTSSIRSLHSMDTENCFLSASKDKTVRLWSISSCGDGMEKQSCQFCYSRHKKSVFSVAYVESMRLVASCDSTVHVWDPYTGVAVSQLESPKYSPVVALTALPAPSTVVAMATTEATLRFLDMRTSKYTHAFRCSLGNSGLIRCVVVSPDSKWIAVGFSTGLIYILDVNSGILLHFWKAHDGEILQLKAYRNSRLLSSAFDQTTKLWNTETGQEVCPTKFQSEPVHCLALFRDQLLSATTANRISVYASVTDSTPFSSSKLRTGTFKGVMTYMSVLPLNKSLLLGADNGTIRLMA